MEYKFISEINLTDNFTRLPLRVFQCKLDRSDGV